MKFCHLSWDSKQYEPFSHISAAVGCFLSMYSFILSGEKFEPMQEKGRIREDPLDIKPKKKQQKFIFIYQLKCLAGKSHWNKQLSLSGTGRRLIPEKLKPLVFPLHDLQRQIRHSKGWFLIHQRLESKVRLQRQFRYRTRDKPSSGTVFVPAKKTCLCSYTLPVPALCVVWFRLAAPVPLPPRNPPRKLRPRRNRPDTPNVSVLSFLSSAHVVRLELNKTPFRLEWPRSLLKILLIFLFFLLAVWDLRVACYTMLHVQLFTQF